MKHYAAHPLTLIMLLVSSCSTFEENTYHLRTGQSSEYVEALLGEAPDEDRSEGQTRYFIFRREYGGEPFDYVTEFYNDGLVRWGYPAGDDRVSQAVQRENTYKQQRAQALRALGETLNTSQSPGGGNCQGQIPPIAPVGCQYVCINGAWANVCQ